ncbi:uncharacterized protein [Primulina huaijiensis]|uniref:uncharacterized protein n=1 Tax=Primulina huaijiensis TaxID=1492673 RepID=UPI003CC75039
MEDSGEGKPAEPRRTTEEVPEVEEEMGSAPEEEMKSLSENAFCSVDAGGAGPSGLHGRSFPEVEEIKKHYCKECDKGFSCGKALGGHMSSAHAQANKGIHGKKRDFKNQHKASSLPQVACRVCGKRFKSNKSLYGHMKNHPDRNWRGVSPPPEARIEFPPASPQQNMNDPGHVLAWPVTAKRGRAASKQADIEEGIRLAAHQLLHLLNSNPVPKGLKICEREGGDEEIQARSGSEMILENGKGKAKIQKPKDSSSCIKDSSSSEDDAGNNSNVMFDVTVRYPTSENGKEEIKLFEPKSSRILVSSYDDEDEEYSTGSNKRFANGSTIEQTKDQNQPNGAKVIVSKNKSKMASKASCSMVEAGSSSDSSTRSKYVCSVCGKRFDSHKALGGHRASHNRFKISIYNTNGKTAYVTSSVDVAAKNSEQRAEQEQGGAAAAASGRPGGAEEEPELKVESKILDFDLNESPRCDEAE